MHNHDATGNEFFVCDFCRRAWAEDRPMVEGHQGSLICASCLSFAYDAVINRSLGSSSPPSQLCTLCLEHRDGPHFNSPLVPEAWACLRCIKQSATILEKDPDYQWKRPTAGGAEPSAAST